MKGLTGSGGPLVRTRARTPLVSKGGVAQPPLDPLDPLDLWLSSLLHRVLRVRRGTALDPLDSFGGGF